VTPLLLPVLLAIPGVRAQDPCNPPPSGLEDLASLFGLIYDYTDEKAADPGHFCPDDLGRPLDLADADARADRLSQEDREAAAEFLASVISTTDKSHTQALANAAALLDALLGAALADRKDTSAILDALLKMYNDVENDLVRRQIALNLWRRGLHEKDPRVKALVEKYLPTAPDYDHLLPKGTTEVNAILHSGDDGFKHSDFKEVFERAGATVTEEPGGDLKVVYKVKPDDPALPEVTWNITIRDAGWPPRGVLADFGNDDVNVSMYGNHSQLGTSIDSELGRVAKSAGSTDIYWMDACKSKVFASRLTQAFPTAHFVYTKNSEYFHDMPLAFQRGLVGLTNHYDYREMDRYVGSGSLYQGHNYIYPDDEKKLAYFDQDGDGVSDAEDRVHDFKPGYEGELGSRAVHIANTYMGYSDAYGSSSEDMYRPDGIFDGDKDGPVTRIEERKDAYGQKKYFVQVNDEALGWDQSQRTASIAAEIGQHWGQTNRWSKGKTEAGAFLLGGAVYDVWNGGGYESYNQKYLSDVSINKWDLGKHLDDHDFVTGTKLSEFQKYLETQRAPKP
jgi:hypothetical protein